MEMAVPSASAVHLPDVLQAPRERPKGHDKETFHLLDLEDERKPPTPDPAPILPPLESVEDEGVGTQLNVSA